MYQLIRNSYWHLHNLRGGRFGEACRRKQYRLVAVQKKTPAVGRRLKA